MYIIITAFVIGFIFISINIIKDFIFNLQNKTSNNYNSGIIWFSGLIILNILIIIFIFSINYYLKNFVNIGDIGQTGFKGMKGSSGINTIKCTNEN